MGSGSGRHVNARDQGTPAHTIQRPARQPRVIAHRGASSIAPENTMLAFTLAVESGAEMIETDAQLSRDGEIVLIHDADLGRTTNYTGRVADWSASEMEACDAGYWFSVDEDGRRPFRGLGLVAPRLAELLDFADAANRNVFINIELKSRPGEIDFDRAGSLARQVVNGVRDHDAVARVLVSSFNLDAIDCVKELEPAIETSWVCGLGADLRTVTSQACARGHSAIHPHHSSIGSGDGALRVVDAMHAAGLAVNVWTVNDAQRMLELALAGVDGIITDSPASLRCVLENWPIGE